MFFYALCNRKGHAMPAAERRYFRLSPQTVKTVKLNVLFMFAFLMQVSASSWSQVINYSGNNVPLATIFGVVKQQTGYVVLYNPDMVKKAAPVSINVRNMPLSQFLDKVLTQRALGYSLEDKTIFITKRAIPAPPEKEVAAAEAPEVILPTISGFVRDDKGELLPGISVKVKGAVFGTTTNGSGYFKLNSVHSDAILLFSSVGYETVNVPIEMCCNKVAVKNTAVTIAADGSLILNVSMKLAVKSLEEIAITNTGYQEISKERSTAAVSTISSKDIQAQINPDLIAALEGKAPGLSLYRNEPTVRGISTFSGNVGTYPLVVLDGLLTENTLDMINPYDVESVTVLKDAAAASIYGARAANGVIVINTKKAKRGQFNVSVNADYFITERPDLSKMHYATTAQMVDYEKDIYAAELRRFANAEELFNSYGSIGGNSIKYFTPLYNLYRRESLGEISMHERDASIEQLKNYDYFQQFHDNVWRNEARKRFNIAVSSGSEKSNTYLSINYDGNNQLVRSNTSENLNIYLKSTFTPRTWLSATFGANGAYSKAVEAENTYTDYTSQPRYSRIVDENGNKVYSDYVYFRDGFSTSDYVNGTVIDQIKGNTQFKSLSFNLLDELDNSRAKLQALRIRTFADVNATLLAGLKYSIKFQYETSRTEEENLTNKDDYRMRYLYNAMTTYNPTSNLYTHEMPYNGRLYQMNRQSNNFTFRQQLDFDRSFEIDGRTHDLIALGGFEMRQSLQPVNVSDLRYGYDPVTLTSQPVDWNRLGQVGVNSYMFGNTTIGYQPGNRKEEVRHRFASYYGNIGYTFDRRYNLTASARLDQTDLFGTDPKYRNRPLWSVGAGWNATNEAFLNDVKWLDYLKVRATYGINGNIDQNSSPYITARLRSDNLFTELQYTDILAMPNPKLRWEKTATVNFGTDFTLFNSLLRGSIDYYRKYSSDLIVATDLDPTVGTNTLTINNGAMSNRGVELSLSSEWLRKGDFGVLSNIVLAFNRNRIEKVTSAATSAYSYIGSPTNYYYANTPFNSIYAYRYGGMINGYPFILNENGEPNLTFDANGNPTDFRQVNSPSAIVRVGTMIPKFNGSFRQSFRYKTVELGAMFAFYGGHQMRRDRMDFSGTDQLNAALGNRYTDANPNGNPRMEIDYPDLLRNQAANLSSGWRYADIQVVSATSVKLRNLYLSYTLPQHLCKSIAAKNVKFTAQANNLWMWSAAGDDMDPETMSLNSGTRNLPTQRSFLFGAAVSF
ncbi:SusC/RagA family TonB-linked outer membrane protein [Chitinophaga rhizophila]|uniref:SusC/RagA family TonB-linked outer membrane protein n=1 Tax=Chitinophaga rhizophila TaxID=2866212 RepID=A0ABS7GBT7_9BACT|nr:SusC/RagA family TonB-linked outer membrane protein [Chitinophaga rhizophila]MBW8684796.1 SusC/RagA family TonB-linked outer membrane protein [Chitinophaga rhizophila]